MFDYVNNNLLISFDSCFSLNKDVQLNYETHQSNMMYIQRCMSRFSKITFHYIHSLQNMEQMVKPTYMVYLPKPIKTIRQIIAYALLLKLNNI